MRSTAKEEKPRFYSLKTIYVPSHQMVMYLRRGYIVRGAVIEETTYSGLTRRFIPMQKMVDLDEDLEDYIYEGKTKK